MVWRELMLGGGGAFGSSVPIGPMSLLLSLVLAAGLGIALAFNYRFTAKSTYSPDVARAQIVLSVLMSIVMVVVGDHLSRAFGAVGILSVMRFRVKMQGATEAANLLGAVVVGMAAGVAMYQEAVVAAIGLVLLANILSWLFVTPDSAAAPIVDSMSDNPTLEWHEE